MTFKTTIPLVFNCIAVAGVLRSYSVLTKVVEKPLGAIALDPTIYIPLACVVFSVAAAILAQRANLLYTDAVPDASTTCAPALFAWATAAIIAILCYVAVPIELFPVWLGAYAILCLLNAGWNFCAVSRDTRTKHVVINFALGLCLIVLLSFKQTFLIPNDLLLMHVLLVGIIFITHLKRSIPRRFVS